MPENTERKPLVALGVTGCIGAYKSAEILRRLRDHGCRVQPILTAAAQRFITPRTLQSLAGRPAIKSLWDDPQEWGIEHIELSDRISLLLVAPATANTVAKFAAGIADDFLSTLYISCECPVLLAPAMNTKMWRHPATRANIAALRERGVIIVEPGEGPLACGWEGIGRLAEVPDILDAVSYALRAPSRLDGRKVVVSAGPTVEEIDPLRFLGNGSSGRMGYALAWEARARGAEVVLVSGPTALRAPWGTKVKSIRSAAEMKAEIEKELENADVVIMAAAVADYRPKRKAESKLKKTAQTISLELEPTDDILAWLGSRDPRPLLIGFAAESENLKEYALAKLKNKGADLIVANPVGGPDGVLGTEETEGMILAADGSEKVVSRRSKSEMARLILDEAERLLKQ